MGLGILEDKHMASPPGTANITSNLDELEMENANSGNSHLKKSGNIILQPQPSDDPNDPLNWSPLWKNSIITILAISSAVTTSLGPMIQPGLIILAEEFKVPLDTISQVMVGSFQFFVGITTFFTAAGANVWGKRPFFLISTVILLVTCVWGYLATSFPSLTAMRVIQGMASAPLETLVTSTVSDLFFIHQRGKRLAIWTQMLGTGVLAGQIISGFIIESMGPLATFGVCAIIYLVLLPITYFVILETAWNGPHPKPTSSDKPLPPTPHPSDEKPSQSTSTTVSELFTPSPSPSPPSPKPYTAHLSLFSGRISPDSFLKGILKPIPLIIYPAVLFSTLVFSVSFTGLILQSLLSVTIFSSPPYLLSPSQIGLTNLAPLVTNFLGTPLAGLLSDFLAKRLSRANGGTFEPEFRLLTMLVAVPFSTASFLGTGYAVANAAPLPVLLVLASFQALAVPFAAQAALAYVIDCHPKDANQAFVTISFVRAVLIFVVTGAANGWYVRFGPVMVFNAVAGVTLATAALTLPAYVFGKRFRSGVARSRLAGKLG